MQHDENIHSSLDCALIIAAQALFEQISAEPVPPSITALANQLHAALHEKLGDQSHNSGSANLEFG